MPLPKKGLVCLLLHACMRACLHAMPTPARATTPPHTPGLRISGLQLEVGWMSDGRSAVLLDALSVHSCEVFYPSFTKPVSLSIKGATVELRQNRNPKARGSRVDGARE